jgi:uncharacterized protein (TIGR03000 family)
MRTRTAILAIGMTTLRGLLGHAGASGPFTSLWQALQTETESTFVTPPLQVGKTYTHTVRVRWQVNGKPVQQTRTVEVTGGGNVRVDFTRPPPRSKEGEPS